MKFRLFFIAVLGLYIVGCSNQITKKDGANGVTPLTYEVDLNDRSDDTFKVKLYVDDLTEKNAVYQFASTAPGTYITMDMNNLQIACITSRWSSASRTRGRLHGLPISNSPSHARCPPVRRAV